MADLKVMVFHPKLLDTYVEELREARPDLEVLPCPDAASIARNIEDIDILFASVAFPGEMLEQARRLKWIQVMGAGVEAFTLSGLVPPGVRLTRVSGSFGPRMAEYVLAHMLATTQGVLHAYELQKKKSWEPYDPQVMAQMTAGVVGLGSIGCSIAERLKALGMRVLGLDLACSRPDLVDKLFSPDEISDLAAQADFLILALPLTGKTRGMIDRQVLEAMKKTGHIINISRGPLIVEDDLVEALETGTIGGAILDVVDQEPLPPDSPLWTVPGLRITPHMSGPAFPSEVLEVFFENLERFERGKSLVNEVDLKLQF